MSHVPQAHATPGRESPARAVGGSAGEFLTFVLGREEYGVEILNVQEIRSYEPATRLPDAPGYIKGVINLRGTIVPVVDMRLKFGLENVEYDALTVTIVLAVGGRAVSIVVDGVSDVVRLDASQVREVPELAGAAIDRKFLTGIGTQEDRMLILLDIEQLMLSAEMGLVTQEPADPSFSPAEQGSLAWGASAAPPPASPAA